MGRHRALGLLGVTPLQAGEGTNEFSVCYNALMQRTIRIPADLNAARNIAAKYRAGGGTSPAGGLRNQPIVSTSDSCGREEQAARFQPLR
jgi:hypothetical protein